MVIQLVNCTPTDKNGYGINTYALVKHVGGTSFSLDLLHQVDITDFIVKLANNIDGKFTSWRNLQIIDCKYIGLVKLGNMLLHPSNYKYIGLAAEYILENDKIVGWKLTENYVENDNINRIKTKSNITIIRGRTSNLKSRRIR